MPVTPETTAPTVWTLMADDVLGPAPRSGGADPDDRAELFGAGCPSRRLLDTVTSRWGVLVLLALDQRTMRYGELHRYIAGISEKMLAQTLRAFEAEGLLRRESAGTVPPRVDYSLTDRGRQAAAVVTPLVRWVGQDTVATARRTAAPPKPRSATAALRVERSDPAREPGLRQRGQPQPAALSLSLARDRCYLALP